MSARVVEREVERGIPRRQYPITGTPLVWAFSLQGEVETRAMVGEYEQRDAEERAGAFEPLFLGDFDRSLYFGSFDNLEERQP